MPYQSFGYLVINRWQMKKLSLM